ncbi:MAG: GlxA family transcriptional regulator [Rhizobiaceae bacterium]|nr:GlxA family transcriptional regulator [Rhizobiaceae bacterium]
MDNTAANTSPFRIGFLLIDGFALMAYAAAIEPLRAANQLAGKQLYEISHFAVSGESAFSSSGASIAADASARGRLDFDLVLVVAGGEPAQFNDPPTLQWLRHLAKNGVQLGGVSGGPVILAMAGLMNGRRMTVHWEHAEALIDRLPELMIERSLYVIDRDRITCAGGIAPLDLMHALITEHHGTALPAKISDWFMHTQIRPSGGPQRAGLVERYGTTSRPVIVALEVMTNHIADPLTLNQLAGLANISPRQLNRLFKEKLDQSAMSFYRDIRLEKAHNFLTQSTLSTTQIALATGFAGSAHFSTSFSTKYGHPPSSIRG